MTESFTDRCKRQARNVRLLADALYEREMTLCEISQAKERLEQVNRPLSRQIFFEREEAL